MTESSTTKNVPSIGRSLARGVEEDTPATDCQTLSGVCVVVVWPASLQQVDISDHDS